MKQIVDLTLDFQLQAQRDRLAGQNNVSIRDVCMWPSSSGQMDIAPGLAYILNNPHEIGSPNSNW